MSGILRVFKREVREQPAYSLPAAAFRIKLNQNENPFPLPHEIKEEILQAVAAADWNRYPQLGSGRLREAVAEWQGLSAENVLVGNGSNELLLAVFQAVLEPGKTLLTVAPTFSLYRHYGRILGARVAEVPLGERFQFPMKRLLEALEAERPELAVLCSPNNPTGSALKPEDLRILLREAPGIVLLDEAYAPFNGWNAGALLAEHENLILIRTFSKAFAFAFGRFGYALGNAAVFRQVAKVLLPYNLSGLTETAAHVLIRHAGDIRKAVAAIVQERERLYRALCSIPGLQVFPSRANFLLIEPARSAGMVFEELLRRGILVRNVSGYPGLSNHLRITVGRPGENDEVISALREILAPEKLLDSAARKPAGHSFPNGGETP